MKNVAFVGYQLYISPPNTSQMQRGQVWFNNDVTLRRALGGPTMCQAFNNSWDHLTGFRTAKDELCPWEPS